MYRYIDIYVYILWLARSASALLRVCTKSGIVPARPDPARPDPARPAISATRRPALKMADLGPSVFPESGPAKRGELGGFGRIWEDLEGEGGGGRREEEEGGGKIKKNQPFKK